MSKHPSLAGIPLVLGGNVFGWTADRDTSFEVLDAFYEAGGRMIDTAECYSFWVPGHSGGESEAVIGAWLADRGVRKEMRVATKTNVDAKPGGLQPDVLNRQLAASLERLQTDYVDLYYAHRDDPETPQDEVAEGFGALIASGKVREAGASNFTAQRFYTALEAAEDAGVPGYGVLQNEYNLVSREAYPDPLQQLCLARDVAVLPYYALASGYLTGKYRNRTDLAGKARGQGVAKYLESGAGVLKAMDAIVKEVGATHAQVALAWLLEQPGIVAPIASATTADQVDDLVEMLELELSPEQIAALSDAL